MSIKIICDGCELELEEHTAELSGQRNDMFAGVAGLPFGKFDLCLPCAVTAFHAMALRDPGARVNIAALAEESQQVKKERKVQ